MKKFIFIKVAGLQAYIWLVTLLTNKLLHRYFSRILPGIISTGLSPSSMLPSCVDWTTPIKFWSTPPNMEGGRGCRPPCSQYLWETPTFTSQKTVCLSQGVIIVYQLESAWHWWHNVSIELSFVSAFLCGSNSVIKFF